MKGTANVDAAEVMRLMSFVGRMECVSHRLQEATAFRPSGKSRQVRLPIVSAALTQNASTGSQEALGSQEAQTDAMQAMAKLAESKAECSRGHHNITTGIEAVQE